MKSGIEFDETGLLARIARATKDVLKRAGAYVRTVARKKVLTSPKPSLPGQPPHSRRGLLKRAILFGLDRDGKSVLVGPGFNLVGESAAAHEFGGRYRRERYPKRPLMGPSLKDSAPHLAKMWNGAVK
ncbi:MAG: hypothetical protein ACI4Q3_03415 [Kiritimatiellia bacterium]